jgi:hypothetical protein
VLKRKDAMNENHDPQLDERLDALLRGLPDAPVASNFTARVLQAVDRDLENQSRATRAWRRFWPRLHWLPRFAVPALALGFGLFVFQYHQGVARAQMAESIVAFAQVSSLPSPEVLKDFEAVRRLSQTPPADEELLALLR